MLFLSMHLLFSMKTLKKVIRALVLIVLIIFAASGVLAIFLPPARERPMDKENRIERIDKKKAENGEDNPAKD